MPWASLGPPAARPAVVAAALLVGQQVAGKAARDALFLSNFEVSSLPSMTAGAAVLSLAGALLFARGMAVLSPARLMPAALGASVLLFVVEWDLVQSWPRTAAVVLYLHQAVLGAALLSSFWSLVNESFDPYTARRAMGAIGVGASLGGVIGGMLTWRAAAVFSFPALLLGLAAANALGLASVRRLKPARAGARPEFPHAFPDTPVPGGSGLRLVRENPYLRDLAVLVAACAFLDTLLDYLLSAGASASIAKGTPLVSFFALFHGASGLLALLVQATLVRPSLERLGLAGTLVLQPAFAAAGALVAASFPRLSTVVALRLGQAVLRNSAFRSSYELLYTPLPPEQKRPAKAIVDVGCDRLGTVLGSATVMLVLALAPAASTRALLLLTAAAALVGLALAPRFHGGYVGALATSLRSGALNLESVSVLDATTRLTLASLHQERPQAAPRAAAALVRPPHDPLLQEIRDLRSRDPERVRAVLAREALDPALVPHLIPLLAQDALFDAAAYSLRRAAPRCTGQLIDALLDPELEPVVRRRIPRVLRSVPTQRVADGLLLGLADARFDLRYRCAQALLRLRVQNAAIALPSESILQAALAEAAGASKSARHLDCVFVLLELVLPREPLETALRAVRFGDDGLRGTALEYLHNVLPAAVRDRLWPQLAGDQRPARSGRTPEEIRDDLLRSTSALAPPQPADTDD